MIVPYDELTSWKNDVALKSLVPQFFIKDLITTVIEEIHSSFAKLL